MPSHRTCLLALTAMLAACPQNTSSEPLSLCPVDAMAFNGQCMTCPPGTSNEAGDDPNGDNTACDPILCEVDHRVVNHECQPCAPGMFNRTGGDASQGNTRCAATRCEADEHVVNNQCLACPTGWTNQAGDDASGTDTECEAKLCSANEAVRDNICIPCSAGSTNEAGDNASTEDTECDPCPAGTFDQGNNQCTPCAPGSIAEPGQTQCIACSAGTFAAQDQCLPCPSDLISNEGASSCHVVPAPSLLSSRDYGYAYWPTNHWHQWRRYLNVQHIQTGYYGLSFDVSNASFNTLGPIQDGASARQALSQPNAAVTELAGASVRYALRDGNTDHAANGFYGRVRTDRHAPWRRALTNPSELIDMGRFMQRIEIPEVTYESNNEFTGSIQLAAMTRHFVLTQRVQTTRGGRSLTLETSLGGEALSNYPQTQRVDGRRALTVSNEAGEGWTFILYRQSQNETLGIERAEDGGLVFSNTYAQTQADQTLTLSVLAIPSTAVSDAMLTAMLRPDTSETIRVEYGQLRRDGSEAQPLTQALWDSERGAYVVRLGNLVDVGAPRGRPFNRPDIHNWYNRHRLVIRNAADQPLSVPIAFDGGGNATFYIVGGSPILRDARGEPVGAPIQISKNWHDGPAWYHLYSALELAPGSHEFELTFAHSKWGETYAAAHAQLSLIGWGQNQQWDQSSLGAFGESITYDPDLTLGRAMVDDVRPFLVDAGTRWNWTGNVGGADFLRYFDDANVHQRLGRLRTHYEYTGPNLTQVMYSGITRDQAIRATIKTQLGRTDDMVRAYYHLDYEVLEDIEYNRFALFQLAADRYSDNGFTRYAYGDAGNLIFDGEITNHRTTGYADADQRGIAIDGAAPWVMLYDNQRTGDSLPERLANVGFIIRSYRATIGQEVVTIPHINLHRTFNGGFSQIGFELGIPYDPANRTIPAGSRLTAVIEYVVPPADKSAYYGQSDYLLEMPAEHYQSTAMLQHLATENQVIVETTIGSVEAHQPVVLDATSGATAVQFRLSGGLGYVPVTIRGLARPDGWRLEQLQGETWSRVDQSIEGNDYWQAYNRSASDSFELTFNLANQDTQTYRLVR